MILLDFLPIPPSINKTYRFSSRSKTLYKSAEALAFKEKIMAWHLKHQPHVKHMKELLCAMMAQTETLEIQIHLFLDSKRIFTKKGKPKRLDTDNRAKALIDAVSEILELDDKHFFKVSIEKLPAENLGSEFARIWIRKL